MNNCLFCRIIRHEIPASIEYEDEHVLAFNDINPQAPTHVLIVPKRHIATLSDLGAADDQLVGEIVRRAAAIAKARGIAAGGFRTVFNTNRDAGQTVLTRYHTYATVALATRAGNGMPASDCSAPPAFWAMTVTMHDAADIVSSGSFSFHSGGIVARLSGQ